MRLRADKLIERLTEIVEKHPNAQVQVMYDDTYKGPITESADATVYLDEEYAIPQAVICAESA